MCDFVDEAEVLEFCPGGHPSRCVTRSPITRSISAEGAERTRCIVCSHKPRCPSAAAPGREAARTVAFHPDQGWSLLCNGVVLFEDTGELLPDGTIIPPHRAPGLPAAA